MTTKTTFTLGQVVRLKNAPYGIPLDVTKSKRERACENCGRHIAAKELHAAGHFGSYNKAHYCLNCVEEVKS